ncbi:MAG: ABC transporter substrate-binding protein [Actinomycetes bacterium]
MAVLVLPVIAVTAASCTRTDQTAAAQQPPSSVRLGFFPTLTHAPALVGLHDGAFRRHLGAVRLQPVAFDAGPQAVEALKSGAIDLTYIGTNPAVNAFVRSNGEAVRVVAGSTIGGASLVVRPNVDDASDLRGKRVASPQLGNTQDVALRTWLADHDLTVSTAGGGDVQVMPLGNAEIATAFQAGQIAGAWVPEPWATRLVADYDGKRLVDERSLWPKGQFSTAVIVVRSDFLRDHPTTVRAVIDGHLDALESIEVNPPKAQQAANAELAEYSGKALSPEVLTTAWSFLGFSADPLEAAIRQSAAHATAVGLLPSGPVDGLVDTGILNSALRRRGAAQVGAS